MKSVIFISQMNQSILAILMLNLYLYQLRILLNKIFKYFVGYKSLDTDVTASLIKLPKLTEYIKSYCEHSVI